MYRKITRKQYKIIYYYGKVRNMSGRKVLKILRNRDIGIGTSKFYFYYYKITKKERKKKKRCVYYSRIRYFVESSFFIVEGWITTPVRSHINEVHKDIRFYLEKFQRSGTRIKINKIIIYKRCEGNKRSKIYKVIK